MKISRIIIFILTILCTFLAVLNTVFYFILPKLLSYFMGVDSNDAASVGIIGGADGPTAIFVATTKPYFPIILLFILPSILGIAYLIATKRKKDNRN